jgi:hypothetical protein
MKTANLTLTILLTILLTTQATLAYYCPSTGCWPNRDPIEEVGLVDLNPQLDSISEPKSDSYLYLFVDNDGINGIDQLGLWKIARSGGARASADAEAGDTINSLANLIGLSAAEYKAWLTASSGTAIPKSSSQKLSGCERFEIPNTVVAYWAGWGRGFGKWYVSWDSSVDYLNALGFKVDARDHKKGDKLALKKILDAHSAAKELHGLYFWGHGIGPYPSSGLVSQSGDTVLFYSSTGLNYHMGLGLVFACDSNSGKPQLSSQTTGSIYHGYNGTLNPIGGILGIYHVDGWIKPGDQATNPDDIGVSIW